MQAPPVGTVASATSGGGIMTAPPDGDSIVPQSGAAHPDGIIGAPVDPDLMTDTSCLVPYLLYGDDFSQLARGGTDFTSWDIPSGNTFNGTFLLRGLHGVGFKDIQIRTVYRNFSGTVQRYRDIKYEEIPPEGTVFYVNIDGVGYGDYVEVYFSPRLKNASKESPDGMACAPSSLANFSEYWVDAPGQDFTKTLGLMGRFKVFTPIKKAKTAASPIDPSVDLTTPP